MKYFLTIIYALLFPLVVFSQLILTHENQGMRTGDSSAYTKIRYVNPGLAGAGVIWDFSGIELTGDKPLFRIAEATDFYPAGINPFNIVSTDNGYDYFLTSEPGGFREEGYINRGKRVVVTYTEPVARMKFPFTYGDNFRGKFSGTALYNGQSRIDITGENKVEADGWGTLILPDRVLPEVLRVKSVRKGVQTGVCGSTVSTITRYSWYARGYRYPILNISQLEQITGIDSPNLTYTAHLNTAQPYTPGNTGSGNSIVQQTDDQQVTVMVFPNPFASSATYRYFLKKPAVVTLELFDITGKSISRIISRQNQQDGIHEGSLEAYPLGLTPGIYYARFTFDRQVVVAKMVKM